MDRVERRHRSLGESVTEELRTAIVSGALAPGDRLVEDDIADRFGVSRDARARGTVDPSDRGFCGHRPPPRCNRCHDFSGGGSAALRGTGHVGRVGSQAGGPAQGSSRFPAPRRHKSTRADGPLSKTIRLNWPICIGNFM